MRCIWEKRWARLFSAEAAMLFSKKFMGKASLYRNSLEHSSNFWDAAGNSNSFASFRMTNC